MLRAEAGPAWLEATGLPHLWVDVDGRSGGPLARA
jgi:thiamine biosynthesis lipoprotein